MGFGPLFPAHRRPNVTVASSPGVSIRDRWVAHPRGRLFLRIWLPERASQATPVLLMHDSLGCVDLWRDFPARLATATNRAVIAYDRLGFGRSDPRAGRLALDFIADEALTYVPVVLDDLGIDRVVLFGHSVGGGMAVNVAAIHPATCEALITVAAQAFVEERTTAGICEAQEAFAQPDAIVRLRRLHGDKAAWVLQAWTDTWLDPAFADWSLRLVLPHVTCPVLAIHGALDEYGTAAHPTMITELTAGPARMEMLEGIHHVPHREDPDLVIGLITRFLGTVPDG